jgi:hypothetical protein
VPTVQDALNQALVWNYHRLTSAHADLYGDGSTPVPLPPPLHCSPLYPIVRIDSKNNE